MTKIAILLLAAFLWTGVHADAKTPTTKKVESKKLYDKLGGKASIAKVVEEFVHNCATDPRINKFFAATASDQKRLASFKNKLVDQICSASGGPCRYTGKDMKTAHQGMGVTEADFNALVDDLGKALDKFKVAPEDKNTLIGVLAPLKAEIVENKG